MTTGDQRKKEKRNRRVFSLEFKQEAVELVVKEGYSLTRAAKSLSLHLSTLTRWVREYKSLKNKAFLDPKDFAKKMKEEKNLKAENQRLKMENAILKKAAAFFAKESI